MICHKVLAADSMRPNKLKAHLETVYPTYVHKDLMCLHHLERSFKAARFDSTGRSQQQNEAALVASNEISQMIVKTKAHTIDESPIAPCVEIIVKRRSEKIIQRKQLRCHYQILQSNDVYCTLMRISKIKLL